jgi:hypothetical protein
LLFKIQRGFATERAGVGGGGGGKNVAGVEWLSSAERSEVGEVILFASQKLWRKKQKWAFHKIAGW